MKPDFLLSGENAVQLLSQIDDLIQLRNSQEEMDRWYTEFIAVYHSEMDKFYKKISDTPRTLKKRDFLAKQALFDKEVKKTKCRWQRNKVLELDKANVDDPTAFWEFVKALRSNKKSKIPNEVYTDDGVTTTDDPQHVLNSWEREFGSLFAPPDKSEEELLFKRHVENMNIAAEALMETMYDHDLNAEFTMEEVDKILTKSKNGKAPGLDSIVYEVLENNVSRRALVVLFNKCLLVLFQPRGAEQ